MGRSKTGKTGKKKNGDNKLGQVQKKIQERDEHMRGGPPNCVICLAPTKCEPSAATTDVQEEVSSEMRLNLVQSIQLCEMLDVPLSFKEGFQEFPACSSCYQSIERASVLLVQGPSSSVELSDKSEVDTEELEILAFRIKGSLSKFQVEEKATKRKKTDSSSSLELLSFRAKVYQEIQIARKQSKLSFKNVVTNGGEGASRLRSQRGGGNTTKSPLESSGPPNCLICMKGPNEKLEVEPLLKEECSYMLKLLQLPGKLQQDFDGSQAYACSQCFTKLKNITEMYKQIERINIRLGEARQFLEKHLLDLPTPDHAKSSLGINPELVGFVVLRRRVTREMQSGKPRPISSKTSSTIAPTIVMDFEATKKCKAGSTMSDDTFQELCEVIMGDGSDPDSSKGDTSDQPKKFYKDVKCDYCDMTYKCYRYLHKHLNRIHFDILPFPCKLCDQGFTTKERLEKHENVAHLGFKNNECRICRKLFSNRQAMKKHEVKHTGIRRFQCQLCDKNYLAQDALRKHMEAIHGNNKYVCEQCGKELPSKHYLASHIIKHQEKEAGLVRPTRKFRIGRNCTPVVLNYDPISEILNSSKTENSEPSEGDGNSQQDEQCLTLQDSGQSMEECMQEGISNPIPDTDFGHSSDPDNFL